MPGGAIWRLSGIFCVTINFHFLSFRISSPSSFALSIIPSKAPYWYRFIAKIPIGTAMIMPDIPCILNPRYRNTSVHSGGSPMESPTILGWMTWRVTWVRT